MADMGFWNYAQADPSKLALVALCRQLQAWEFGFLDCQVGNPHLFRMGAKEIPRAQFEHSLRDLTEKIRPVGNWQTLFVPEAHW